MKIRKYALLLLALTATRSFSQQVYSTNPDSATLFPTKYGSFENYAFVLNGKVIEQESLAENAGAKLNNVFPYAIQLEGKGYSGAVYFHTEARYAPAVRYADDPAYFINGRQVSPYDIRITKAEAYTRIDKSEGDTTISGKLYRGAIHLETDENYMNQRIALPELIEKYTGLPAEQVIIHWRGSAYSYKYEEDLGTIIHDNFPIYSFNSSGLGLRAIEVDRLHFATGERYVVHLVDNSYKWSKPKATFVFNDPEHVDTLFPCYQSDFDETKEDVFTMTEIGAQPYQGKKVYLKKLSEMMDLSAVKSGRLLVRDSIKVQFIVLKGGMLAALKNAGTEKLGHNDILTAIKKLACIWLPAIQSGRNVTLWREMKIFYSRDRQGNIRSLDSLLIYGRANQIKPPEREPVVPATDVYNNTKTNVLSEPVEEDIFKKYAFIVNGALIEHDKLINYPEARLDRILAYNIGEKSRYQGVVYFHTPYYPPSPPDEYADAPAYFLNGTQVSPYAIRSSRSEYYTHIERSQRDTLIGDAVYRGSIAVETEENFFTDRVSIQEFIKDRVGVPPGQVIVHWSGRSPDALNPGVVLYDQLSLYYINPKGLQDVKVGRVRFAEGERYLVRLVDPGYRYSYLTDKGWRVPRRTALLFDNPMAFDPLSPCYVAAFDTTKNVIRRRAKNEPTPFDGKEVYLKKLSTILKLPAGKSKTATQSDSLIVQFIVLWEGQLTGLQSLSPRKPGHSDILQAIKQNSCVWSAAWDGNRPVLFKRKMVLFYSRDKKGTIQSLDSMVYRYDDE